MTVTLSRMTCLELLEVASAKAAGSFCKLIIKLGVFYKAKYVRFVQ